MISRADSRTDDTRPPLDRLRSLVVEPDRERSRRMMSRTMKDLEETVQPGPWIAASRALAAEGVITSDAVFYFAEVFLECVTLHAVDHDAEMVRLYAEIDEVKRAHGLSDDEEWYVDEGPPEWQALNAAWDARDHELRAQKLRSLGHGDLADELERDPDEFVRRSESGYVDLWGRD